MAASYVCAYEIDTYIHVCSHHNIGIVHQLFHCGDTSRSLGIPSLHRMILMTMVKPLYSKSSTISDLLQELFMYGYTELRKNTSWSLLVNKEETGDLALVHRFAVYLDMHCRIQYYHETDPESEAR